MLVLSLEDPVVAGAGWALLATGASVVVNWLSWGRKHRIETDRAIAVEQSLAQERTTRLGAALDDWQQRVVASMTEIEARMQSQMVQLNQNQQVLVNEMQEIGGRTNSVIEAIGPLLSEDRLIDQAGWRTQVEQAVLEMNARVNKQATILQEIAQLQQQVLDPRTDSLAELTGRLESVQQEFMSRQAARNGGSGGAPGGAGQGLRRS
jgi:hypothetical protein